MQRWTGNESPTSTWYGCLDFKHRWIQHLSIFFIFLRERGLLIHFKISTSSFYLSVLLNCDEPGSPSNGHKRGSWFWTGESVSFLCDPQYHLTGPATRMCLPSGKWSGIQPSCKYLLNCIYHPHRSQLYKRTRFHIARYWQSIQSVFAMTLMQCVNAAWSCISTFQKVTSYSIQTRPRLHLPVIDRCAICQSPWRTQVWWNNIEALRTQWWYKLGKLANQLQQNLW